MQAPQSVAAAGKDMQHASDPGRLRLDRILGPAPKQHTMKERRRISGARGALSPFATTATASEAREAWEACARPRSADVGTWDEHRTSVARELAACCDARRRCGTNCRCGMHRDGLMQRPRPAPTFVCHPVATAFGQQRATASVGLGNILCRGSAIPPSLSLSRHLRPARHLSASRAPPSDARQGGTPVFLACSSR
jgi:hypothetical protein